MSGNGFRGLDACGGEDRADGAHGGGFARSGASGEGRRAERASSDGGASAERRRSRRRAWTVGDRDRAPRYDAQRRRVFGLVGGMTTGPWSVGPESGAVWGGDFPTPILRDAVAEQKASSCSPGVARTRIEVGVGSGGAPPRAAADNESCQADILRRHGSAEAERIADEPFALESVSPAEARHWFPGVRIGVMVVAISPAVSTASDDSRDRTEIGPDRNTLAASARPCHIGYCMSEIRGEIEV